jgi:hypothetical protein
MKPFVLTALALLLAFAALAATSADVRSGVWTADIRDGRVHMNVFSGNRDRDGRDFNNNMGFSLPLARFEALTAADGDSKFTLRAPAGVIAFDGHFSDAKGAGHYTFTPSDGFVREMESLGMSGFTDHQLLMLATTDFEPATLRGLKSMGYDITRHELDEVAVFHITPAVIREYAAAGYPNLTLREVVNFRVGNVTTAYIDAMRQLGYSTVSARELADMAILGVTPEYIRSLRVAGVANLSPREARDLRIGRITPAAIKGYADAGYPNLTARELSEFGIQRVTPEYIESLRKAGFDHLSARQLVEMRIFNIDSAYIREMRDMGVQDLRRMIELRETGAADILAKHKTR